MDNSFLRSVIFSLTQRGWDHLKDYTLVFPMQRAEAYARHYIREQMQADAIDRPVVLPRMVTIDQLVDEWSDLRPEDEIRAVCRLYRIYREYLTEEMALDTFFGWGRQILSDFSSIDMALHDPAVVMRNTADAEVLDRLDIDPALRERLEQLMGIMDRDEAIIRYYHELWDHLAEVYPVFAAQQAEHHLGTKGACYHDVVRRLNDIVPTLTRTYVFVGFNYLLPAERAIMLRLQQEGRALFYWDDDPDFDIDPSVYGFIRENCALLPNQLVIPKGEKTVKPIRVINTTSANAQIQYIPQWLAENHHEGERTAIVVADETMLESVLYALPDTLSDHTNVTKGYPLRNTPLYAEIIRYLSDRSHDRQEGEQDYVGVLSRLAESIARPEVPGEDETATWQQLLRIEAYCQAQLVINRYITLIGEGVLSDIHQLRTLRNILRRSLESVTLPFHGEPIEPIQIIGVLETRLLDFDNILVLNVEEGVVPASPADRSLIPFDIRRAYHIQTREEETRIYAYNFYRLVRRSANVTMLYTDGTSGITKKSMSRFIMQMLLSDRFDIRKYRIEEKALAATPWEVVPDKVWADCAKEWNPSIGRALSLSPSALSTYIGCPRQFYLSKIEGISEAEIDRSPLEANVLGSLVHETVRQAYESLADSELVVTVEAIEGWLSDEKHDATKAVKVDEAIALMMVRNILRYDADHVAPFRIVAQEKKYYRPIPFPDYGLTVMLGGAIDRLDVVSLDGRRIYRVVDYKTGSYSDEKTHAKWDDVFSSDEKRYVMQTLIYCSVYDEYLSQHGEEVLPVVPQLMFTQRLGADKNIYIDGEAVRDFRSDCRAHFEQQIRETIEMILRDTTFEKASEKNCSSFCPFHLLCAREKKDY